MQEERAGQPQAGAAEQPAGGGGCRQGCWAGLAGWGWSSLPLSSSEEGFWSKVTPRQGTRAAPHPAPRQCTQGSLRAQRGSAGLSAPCLGFLPCSRALSPVGLTSSWGQPHLEKLESNLWASPAASWLPREGLGVTEAAVWGAPSGSSGASCLPPALCLWGTHGRPAAPPVRGSGAQLLTPSVVPSLTDTLTHVHTHAHTHVHCLLLTSSNPSLPPSDYRAFPSYISCIWGEGGKHVLRGALPTERSQPGGQQFPARYSCT